MPSLSQMRTDYALGELLEQQTPNLPYPLFRSWLDDAIAHQLPEPNAMTLATVGSNLRPSTRIVLLKEADESGLVWFTNYQSRKGQELAGNPYAALQFHWIEQQRVVRVEGRVTTIDPTESDTYFASRPLASRLGAWASPQSQPIASRATLMAHVARVTIEQGLHPQRPPHWGGYRLCPDRWEFWQGRSSRLHDRLVYSLDQNQGQQTWRMERLAP